MKGFLEVTDWRKMGEKIAHLNPGLAKIIDELSPGGDYTLYKIQYPYGATILKNGVFHLPNDDNTIVPITDPSISPAIRDNLYYNFNSNPVSILLNKSAELFLEPVPGRVIPFKTALPGQLLGTWGILSAKRSFHPAAIWNMTAGARSLFMLPKISDKLSHDRLMHEFALDAATPKTLQDHWRVFRALANSASVHKPWGMEVMYFSKAWFSHLEDPRWQPFYAHLLKNAWEGGEYLRNQAFWDLIFSLVQEKKLIPPNAYICDIVKHLTSVSVGESLAFSSACDEEAAPIGLLQRAYTEGAYRLKTYAPIIMTPGLISAQDYVYYSPQFSSALAFSPRRNKRPGMMNDLTEIRSSFIHFVEEILQGDIDTQATFTYEQLRKLQYDFFHVDADGKGIVRPSQDIAHEDACMRELISDGGEFAPRSSFVRGCVRLRLKK